MLQADAAGGGDLGGGALTIGGRGGYYFFFQGFSRVIARPAVRVRTFKATRGSSRFGSGGVLKSYGLGRVWSGSFRRFQISWVAPGHLISRSGL